VFRRNSLDPLNRSLLFSVDLSALRPDNVFMSEHQKMWKAFEANEISHSVAHYLLAVADNAQGGIAPRAADIARTLDVSRAAVSLQLKTLKEHGLVKVAGDHRISLTRLGQDLVGRIISKRQILTAFFCEVLGIEETTGVSDACKIEHLISEESGASLARFMTFLRDPTTGARSLIDEFRQLTAECPPEETCDFCVSRCLLNSSGPNSKEFPDNQDSNESTSGTTGTNKDQGLT